MWKIVCQFGFRFISPLIQLKMKSKTIEDMNFLKNNSRYHESPL